MLIVFGSHGSPGTSTTAFLISYFCSRRRDVDRTLLIEADPAGGTLSVQLGMDTNPGLVSLLTAPETALDIGEHTQKLEGAHMEKLEILVAPNTIRGAWDTAQIFGRRGPEIIQPIRADIPIVIDAGRIFHTSPNLNLITARTTAAIVIREGYLPALPTLSYMKETCEAVGANAGIISIGKPLWSADEYQKNTGLDLLGWVAEHPEGYIDFSLLATTARAMNKRFMRSIQHLTDSLYETALYTGY